MVEEYNKPHVVIDEKSFYLEVREIDEITKRLLAIWHQSIQQPKTENIKPILSDSADGSAPLPAEIHAQLLDEHFNDLEKLQKHIKKKKASAATTKKSWRQKMDPAGTSEKTCKQCKKTKPLDAFSKKDGGRLGRTHICKTCNHENYLKISKDKVGRRHLPKKSKDQPDIKPEKQPDLKPETPKPEPKKTLGWTPERDQKLRDAFTKKDLGVSGIYDASILPGFSLTEIKQRCQELGLLDQYGLRPEHKGKPGLDNSEF